MTRRFFSTAIVLCAILATGLAASQTAPQAPKGKVLTSLQGVWLMTSADGQDLAGSGQEIVITIKDDKYEQTVNGQVVERGSFRIDESKKPMTLDLLIAEGDDAGQTQLGVIEVDGKTMYGKLGQPGSTARPTDFAAAEGFFTFAAVKK